MSDEQTSHELRWIFYVLVIIAGELLALVLAVGAVR
jgi:hypothetical protein